MTFSPFRIFLPVVCWTFIGALPVFSQNQSSIRQLRQALLAEKDAARGSRLYVQLYDEYRRAQVDSALAVAGEMVAWCEEHQYAPGRIDGLLRCALDLVRKTRLEEAAAKLSLAKAALPSVSAPQLQAQALITEANLVVAKGNVPEGLALCEKGLSVAEAKKDTLNLLYGLDTRARIRFAQGNMTGMQADALRALGLAEKAQRPRQECMAHRTLSVLYLVFTKDTTSFLHHANRCLELARKHQCTYEEAETLTQLSAYHRTKGRFEPALDYAIQAVEKMKGVGIPGRYAAILGGVGYVYISMAAPEKALPWFEQALYVLKSVGDAFNLAISYRGMGVALYEAGGRQEGIAFLLNAYNLCKEHSFLEKQQDIANDLAGRYAEMRDFENAYSIRGEHLTIRDSVFNRANSERIGKMQAEFEFKKKEDRLLFEKQLGDRERERQRLLLVAQENDLLLAQQLGEIQTLSLRQKDDSLARQQLALQLEQADKATQLARAGATRQAEMQQRQILVGILGGLLALAILLIFISRTRSKLTQARLRTQSIESDMRALRAQMNPHFLFNSLNSINAYILRNHTAQASDYLTRFAQLVRQMLDNSALETISLEKELAFLESYLHTETLRLQQKLTYTIQVDQSVDPFETEIPSMVLQPYLENAIWHGIAHRPEGGALAISVSKVGETLLLVLEDNGVGRARAQELENGKQRGHESKGLKITEERLALYSQKYNKQTSVKTIDLRDPEGLPLGTRVEIRLTPAV